MKEFLGDLNQNGPAEKWVLDAIYKLNKMEYVLKNGLQGKESFKKTNPKGLLFEQIQTFKKDMMDLQMRVFDQKRILKDAMAPTLYSKVIEDTEENARVWLTPIFKDYNIKDLTESSNESFNVDDWIEEATVIQNFTDVINELDVQILYLIEMKQGLDEVIHKYALYDKGSLPEFAQMILDISIKQFKDEIMWLYNVNPEQTESFEEIFSDELNQLILIASDSLDKFTQKLDQPLDKINYKILAKIFMFNEITSYITRGQQKPVSSFSNVSALLHQNIDV